MESEYRRLVKAAEDALRRAGLDGKSGRIWFQDDAPRGDLSANHALVQGFDMASALAGRTVAAMELEGTPFSGAKAEAGFINLTLRDSWYSHIIESALELDADMPDDMTEKLREIYLQSGTEEALLSRHDAQNPMYMVQWAVKRALALGREFQPWELAAPDEKEKALIKALSHFGEADSAEEKRAFLSLAANRFYSFYSAPSVRADSARRAICAATARIMLNTID